MVQSYIQCIQEINEPVDALTNFCDDVLIIHSFIHYLSSLLCSTLHELGLILVYTRLF